MVHSKRSSRAPAEAAALKAARHPGVVELVDASEDTVRTRTVDGVSLAEVGPLHPEEVAGLCAALATTVADLHDLGIVHGGIDADHVLLSTDGRPVLCSLGRGGQPADDVTALGRLMAWLVSERSSRTQARRLAWPGRRLGPMLAPPAAPTLAALAADANCADPTRRPSARALATAIHDRVPDARLPRPEPRALVSAVAPEPSPRLRRRLALGSAPLAAVALLGWWAVSGRHPEARPSSAAPRPEAPRPTRARPSPSLQLEGGVLTFEGARYAVGRPGDLAVVGDWACTGRATPVLLRPSSGEVFTYDDWARPGRDVAARVITRLDRASGLRVVDADADRCDDLEVTRTAAPPIYPEVTQR